MALWAAHAGCDATPKRITTREGNTRFAYVACQPGNAVVRYRLERAGHAIPIDTEGGLMALVVGFFGL